MNKYKNKNKKTNFCGNKIKQFILIVIYKLVINKILKINKTKIK